MKRDVQNRSRLLNFKALSLRSLVKGLLIMFDTPEQKAAKAKVLKKLMSKWLSVQATVGKANLLLSKNPEIKPVKKPRKDIPR